MVEVEAMEFIKFHVSPKKGIRFNPTLDGPSSLQTLEKYMLASTLGIWGI